MQCVERETSVGRDLSCCRGRGVKRCGLNDVFDFVFLACPVRSSATDASCTFTAAKE